MGNLNIRQLIPTAPCRSSRADDRRDQNNNSDEQNWPQSGSFNGKRTRMDVSRSLDIDLHDCPEPPQIRAGDEKDRYHHDCNCRRHTLPTKRSRRPRRSAKDAKGGQEQRRVQLRLVRANKPRYPDWLQPQIIAPKRVAQAAYCSARRRGPFGCMKILRNASVIGLRSGFKSVAFFRI
jgi:hypothetical protein